MSEENVPHHSNSRAKNWSQWALIGFLAIAGFFLVTEHRAHLLGVLPYLLLLACPLLHVFHHGAHGRSQDTDASNSTSTHRH